MELLQTRQISCPCCGEIIEVVIDCSAGSREYVEDCQVCCQPMLVSVDAGDPEAVGVSVRREND